MFFLATAGGAVTGALIAAIVTGTRGWPESGPILFVGCGLLMLGLLAAHDPSQP